MREDSFGGIDAQIVEMKHRIAAMPTGCQFVGESGGSCSFRVGNRSLVRKKQTDLLGLSVIEDLKIFAIQIGDRLAILILREGVASRIRVPGIAVPRMR